MSISPAYHQHIQHIVSCSELNGHSWNGQDNKFEYPEISADDGDDGGGAYSGGGGGAYSDGISKNRWYQKKSCAR